MSNSLTNTINLMKSWADADEIDRLYTLGCDLASSIPTAGIWEPVAPEQGRAAGEWNEACRQNHFRDLIEILAHKPGDASLDALFKLVPLYLSEEANWWSVQCHDAGKKRHEEGKKQPKSSEYQWLEVLMSKLTADDRRFAYQLRMFRETASILVQRRSIETLLAASSRFIETPDLCLLDFIASLAHEMIVEKRCDLSETPLARRLGERLKENKHPLWLLPFKLLPVEKGALSGQKGINRTPSGLALYISEIKKEPDYPLLSFPAWTDTTTATRRGQIYSAFASQGTKFEARTLKFSSPINPEDLLEDRLRAFNWTCLAKARREQIKLIEVPVENIVYVLLVSARNGDSINKGVFSAYARLYAWLSIAGLTGLEPDAGFERIVQEALDWRWLRFEAISDWFSYMGHFNLGVVSLDPTNTSLGLLAISDAGIF